MVRADRPVLRFLNSENPTVPLHPRQDHPLHEAQYEDDSF
jgi:hypothetical protein